VVGVTSNPTIFDHALSHGDYYNEQLAELALRGVSVGEASRAITAYDVRWACDVLRPVYDASCGRCGPRRAPRTPPTPTPCTW
jgi:transaldolase